MNVVVLVAAVGAWGGIGVYWVQLPSVVCDWEAPLSRSVPLEKVAIADGWLAAMTARAHQGLLGGKRGGV